MSSDGIGDPMESRTIRNHLLKDLAKKRRCCSTCGARPGGEKSLMKCSRCKQVWYCSEECQTIDWKKRHKIECKIRIKYKQETRDKAGKVAEKLRRKWLELAQPLFLVVLAQCFSDEDFDRQPPEKKLLLRLAFNFNYGTYMPLQPPEQMILEQDEPSFDKYEECRATRTCDQERSHVIHLILEDSEIAMFWNVNLEGIKNSATYIRMGLSQTDEYSHGRFCRILAGIELPKSLYHLSAHTSVCQTNLHKQFDFFENTHAWKRFTINAYRLNEEHNLSRTHVLFWYFLFDFDLGKMKKFTRYEMLPMAEAMERIPTELRRSYLCRDEPSCVPVVLVEEWNQNLFATRSMLHDPPPGFPYWREEQSKGTAVF